jgi:hypothetical protein
MTAIKTKRIAVTVLALSLVGMGITYASTSLLSHFGWYSGGFILAAHVAAYGTVLAAELSLAVLIYLMVSGAIRSSRCGSRRRGSA